MTSTAQKAQLLWFQNVESRTRPAYHCEEYEGSLQAALDTLLVKAKANPAYALGQVLQADGKVFATVAKCGAVHLAP